MRHAAAAVLAIATLLAAPAAARAGDGTDLLGLLPDTVDAVVTIDVADARDSALFVELLGTAMAAEPGMRDTLTDAGISFENDLDTLLCAFDSGDKPAVCVVEGRFPKDILTTISAGSALRTYKGVKYALAGDYAAALVKKRLIVARADGIEAAIGRATARKGKAKKTVASSPDAAALRAMIADTDTRHDAWIATTRAFGGAGFDVRGLSVAATTGTDLAIQARVRFADEDSADKVEQLITQGLAQASSQLGTLGLKQTIDSITVSHSGSLLEAGMTVAASEVSTLVMLLKLI